ncbi:MAG: two-component system response regulator OmpR [endosymbiont of Galathealinum brachiosum]|uniref:Two-component system response regulator OmpR n=1 Tax=endosymbiont of Galathealinum brachiosum TaxID=2200906 RepID=A0A370DMN7_9GAMM|nr:MAG: two-component system response regulator OmpR [endosymbiont of Galathealinum brachiosum]
MSNSDVKLEKILIVDDDKALRDLLKRYLSENGYTIQAVKNGSEMFQQLEKSAPDLIILDLMLPGDDGLTLAKKIRSNKNIPIIILSARGDEVDRIVGLEVGADDYLSKPFNPRELLARIRSVLRRSNTGKDKPAPDTNGKKFDHYRMLSQSRQLFLNDEEVILTSGEFTLLEVFVNNPNRLLNRDLLLQLLKGYEHQPFDRSIDVRITRLRRKIEADPTKPVYIRTVWGKGYLFTPNPEEH